MTARPVRQAVEIVTSSDASMVLNINEERGTDQDIKLFLSTKLNILGLAAGELDQLVEQAGSLFIWSSILVKYVSTSRNPKRVILQFFPQARGAPRKPLDQLYHLYDQILNSAIGRADETTAIHAILGVIFISASHRPFSVDSIAAFLQHDSRFTDETTETVRNTVHSLHAVLYEDHTGPIRVIHPSFLQQQTLTWLQDDNYLIDLHILDIED